MVISLFKLESGFRSGVYNMAMDEALLEKVRTQSESVLIVRTYQWEEPTLSLGIHQKVRDIDFLLSFYSQGSSAQAPVRKVVRRPTGGRAILHGEDISYSFITNDAQILKQSLKASYAVYAGIVRTALERLALSVSLTSDAGERDYLRSPVCFDTHTPSDLVGEDGKKLSGSAQLRRAGGLLQHGAGFLKPYGITEEALNRTLFEVAGEILGPQVMQPLPKEMMASVEPLRLELEAAYLSESAGILASASTTSGSHFVPASP